MIISEESAEALRAPAREELSKLTDEEALEATHRLLDLAAKSDLSPRKEAPEGIIECPRLLYWIR